MKHLKWLKFIEWFFRVWGWLAIAMSLLLTLSLIAIIIIPTIPPEGNNKTLFCLLFTFFISGLAMYYIILQCVWKIFREIRSNIRITNKLLKLINRIKIFLLVSYFHQLLFLITSYITNNFEAANNAFAGPTNMKIELTADFLLPSFGFGMSTLFFFFITLFIHKFLTNYKELRESKEKLEEEQKYVV